MRAIEIPQYEVMLEKAVIVLLPPRQMTDATSKNLGTDDK